MVKVKATHGAYQILEDIIILAGGFAKLGRTLAAEKIQSSADAASHFVSDNVDLSNINAHLSEAKDGLGLASDYALHTDVKQMAEDAAHFARRHPVTSILSVVAVGALVARLMRPEAAVVVPIAKRAKAAPRKAKPKLAKSIAKTRAKTNGAANASA